MSIGSYFKPLRRKVGVVTLVLACLFAAGWVRSWNVHDVFSMARRQQSIDHLVSHCDSLFWATSHMNSPGESNIPFWSTNRFAFPHTVADGPNADILWRWRYCGFGTGEINDQPASYVSRTAIVAIPYWSIVLPLTLLSAWLLLLKPRTEKLNQVPEV